MQIEAMSVVPFKGLQAAEQRQPYWADAVIHHVHTITQNAIDTAERPLI